MSKILVVMEQRENRIKESSFELVTLSKKLSDDVSALVIGESIADEAKRISKYGISNIKVVEHKDFKNYSPDGYAKVIEKVVKAGKIDVVLLLASAMGRDLSGRVGEKIGAAVAQDCIQLDKNFTAVRPIYAGKILARVCLTTNKKVFTLRGNIFQPSIDPVEAQLEQMHFEETFSTIVQELVMSSGEKLDVSEASIIVTGGRGMGGPENWHLIESLAKTLNAATGASRAVVDAGWRPYSEQIGQTGKTVSPNLYIACGVSGAIQHLAGMKTSKYIVAINKDSEAPIFKVADYGIVGDVMDVLPKLNDALKVLFG